MQTIAVPTAVLDEVSTAPKSYTTKKIVATAPVPTVRPWVRFWARFFDVLLCANLLAYVVVDLVAYTAPQLLANVPTSTFFWSVAGTLMLAFVEAPLLTIFGTTPGKWLFKTRIARADSSPITYGRALKRSLLVWVRGIGMGLPLIPLLTMARGHRKLLANGITSWDKDCGFTVHHDKLGTIRATALIAIVLVWYAAPIFASSFLRD